MICCNFSLDHTNLEIACYDLEKSYTKSFNLPSQKITGENNKNVKICDCL